MAVLSDDPVTGIDFVPRGARVEFDDGTNFEDVCSRFKIMQVGIWGKILNLKTAEFRSFIACLKTLKLIR